MGAITQAIANNITLGKGHGGMTLLQSAGSNTATANIVFDSLDVTTYSSFLLEWQSQPEADNTDLYMQMRNASGNITTSQYNSAGFGCNGSTFSGNYSWHENSIAYFRVHKNSGNASNESHACRIHFVPRKSTMENRHGNFFTSMGLRYDASSTYRSEFVCGSFNDGGPPTPNGFRIYYATNNILAYDYKLYGLVE